MLRCAVDHPSASFRHGVASALDPARFEVVEGEEAADADVVLMLMTSDDTSLTPEASGATVVALVEELAPHLYRRALALGADGVCHDQLPPDVIVDVVDAAVSGEVTLPAEVARRLAVAAPERSAPQLLTDEERGLLQRHADGASLTELARTEHLGERTVRRRFQNICLKLGADTRAEAIKRATQLGIIG